MLMPAVCCSSATPTPERDAVSAEQCFHSPQPDHPRCLKLTGFVSGEHGGILGKATVAATTGRRWRWLGRVVAVDAVEKALAGMVVGTDG